MVPVRLSQQIKNFIAVIEDDTGYEGNTCSGYGGDTCYEGDTGYDRDISSEADTCYGENTCYGTDMMVGRHI